MSSVTHRIKEVKQPRGGYIPPKEFCVKTRLDGIEIKQDENIHSSIIGMAVDYLTRFMMGASLEEAFAISLLGASMINDTDSARKTLRGIRGLDDISVVNACKLTRYDVCVRAGIGEYKPDIAIEPDADTLFNIRTMVNRSVEFWNEYGPVVKSGFTFAGGYTDIISSGDGDYITKDTLWDFKVSKDTPKITHTLQLLVYYIMGCHSINKEFVHIRYLGIFNPRLNMIYTLNVTDINQSIINEVSTIVIGYPDSECSAINDKANIFNTANAKSDDWLLYDLIRRYDVSRAKITSDFFSRGLPHSMVGRAYHFSPRSVIEWEINQQYIRYGKNQYILLPAFKEYVERLTLEIKKAKKAGDKARVRALKQEAKSRNVSIRSSVLNTILYICLIMAFIVLIMILLKIIDFS